MWGRRHEGPEHADRECLIETIERIQGWEQAPDRNAKKMTLRKEVHGMGYSKRTCTR